MSSSSILHSQQYLKTSREHFTIQYNIPQLEILVSAAEIIEVFKFIPFKLKFQINFKKIESCIKVNIIIIYEWMSFYENCSNKIEF